MTDMFIEREIQLILKKDLDKKIILLGGPRQCGKTTLAKHLMKNAEYLNYDNDEDRIKIKKKQWDRSAELVIFDEIHKMPLWKRWLKGLYDTEGVNQKKIITGSSKMDIVKQMGDSLAGRHFTYTLLPFSPDELEQKFSAETIYKRMLKMGSFPEPFLENDEAFYKKWRNNHLDIILKQDLLGQEQVRDIEPIRLLIQILEERVGSTISYLNLARDLEKDAKTIKRWLLLLERLYVIFRVPPYSKKITRSVLKEGKYYFYDVGRIRGDEAQKLENIIALKLKTEIAKLESTQGCRGSLYFLRSRNGPEMDFYAEVEDYPSLMCEVKLSDNIVSKHFRFFSNFLPKARKVQLVRNLDKKFQNADGVEVRSAVDWLVEDVWEKNT